MIPPGMASRSCRAFFSTRRGEPKRQGVEGFQSQAGPVRRESHHQTKLLIFSFSAYLFGELFDRQKKPFTYSSEKACRRAGQFYFILFYFFGGLKPGNTFFSFFEFFEIYLTSARPPFSQASKPVAFYSFAFSTPRSRSSYGRKRRLTSALTLLDRCEMIHPGGIIESS